MVANRAKFLFLQDLVLCWDSGAHRPLSIAGGPTGKQGVMVGDTRGGGGGSLFSVEELN